MHDPCGIFNWEKDSSYSDLLSQNILFEYVNLNINYILDNITAKSVIRWDINVVM